MVSNSMWKQALFTALAVISAWGAPPVDPGASQKAGMDPAVLQRIPKRMQELVDQGVLSGAVTLVQRHGTVASLEAVGWADR
ncbi:MAG TPA: hypothetical protein VFQ91_09940 [Bryobacteraceae bacterium]|nr:hypothetical protein [Bryobacteraceae bacterium]